MNEREAWLPGERLPLWVALALAAFGLAGAVTASQLIAELTADDSTAAPAVGPSGPADRGSTDGVARRASADDPAQPEGNADDDGNDPGADDVDASSTDADTAGQSVAPPADCPPLFVLRFATGSAEPDDADPARAVDLVAWLGEHPEAEILLEGHADAAGSEEGNLQLSFRRAEAAAALLADSGASPDRLQARGFGEYQPLVGEAPDSGRNRRVTMQVVGLDSCPSNDDPTDQE